eukprot:15326034-Ditylum_brightwellii.AAC.1
MASVITPWIDIIRGRLGKGDCSLSMTDSSTSEGWSAKTNFKSADYDDPEKAAVQREVARHHVRLFMDYEIREYSQWFKGDYNNVSDALSRDDDRDDEELTKCLQTFVPSQMPSHFRIVPLPKEISSWLISLLQRLPVKTQLQEKHKRTSLGHGTDGSTGVNPLASSMISFLTGSQDTSASISLEPLPWLSVADDFRDRLSTPWLRAQSEVPCHMWHRPSGITTDQTQQRMKMENLADFYIANSVHSKTKTQTKHNRKHYTSVC